MTHKKISDTSHKNFYFHNNDSMVALTDHDLQKLLTTQQITHCDTIDLTDYIQPASIDLPIGKKIYHLQQKFLPFKETIREKVKIVSTQCLSTENGIVLYKGQTYLIPCLDISLGSTLSGKISPKSSLGRIDVLIRAIVDNTGLYDTLPAGTQGELRLEVTPQSFNIAIHSGNALSQLMIFEQNSQESNFKNTLSNNTVHGGRYSQDNKKEQTDTIDNSTQTQFLFGDNGPLKPWYYDNKLIVGLGIASDDIIGYKARFTNKIIDINKIGFYDWRDFFEAIYPSDYNRDSNKQNENPDSSKPLKGDKENDQNNDFIKNITLEQGRFYILPTKEKIRVPDAYSIELLPFTHLMGELRVHYAGFFDPGFGGDTGSTGVLEIRPHEDTTITHGQPICMMKIYKNKSVPTQPYGKRDNNYQGQSGPKLAKYFAS